MTKLKKGSSVLTTDQYIDGRNEIIDAQKKYDKNTTKLSKNEHMRVINIRIRKNITKENLPNTIPVSELREPTKEMIEEVGDTKKCKWSLKNEFKAKYETIIENIIRDHAKEKKIKLVDFIFYDTIYDDKQYYEGFARGLDSLTLGEVGLKPMNITKRKRAKLIKKAVDKINTEWQLKKI